MTMLFGPDPADPPPPPRGVLFLLAGAIVTLLLLLGAVAITSEYHRTIEAREKLARSYQRRILVADLLSHVQAAGTARHDPDAARNAAVRTSYRQATVAIARQRRALERLLPYVPPQAARYAVLGRAIDIVTDPRDGMAVEARHRAVAQVRRLGAAMMAEEDAMIAARVTMDNDRVAAVQRQLGLLVTVLAVLAGAALTLEWRGRRSRHRLAIKAHAAAVRLRGVFAATSDAVALIDPNGRIEVVNPAVEHLFGYSADALIGQDIAVLIDAMPAEGTFLERLDLHDDVLREPLRLDRIAHHRDGRDLPVDVALGLMPVPTGLHVVAAIRDVSERKSVERIKDEFVATVSHELRTPLTSIVGALGLLRATAATALPESGRRLVQVAAENSQRLIDLVNDLLDIEKMGAGELRFRNQPVDLTAVLRQVVEGGEALASGQEVRILLSHADGPISVRGDEGRLAQVATNLLANAIRFSPRCSTVTVTTTSDQGRAVVTVDDRGPGVPSAFRDRLFTRFAQYEQGGASGGTGLGLAISRQIVRAHGGTIWFEPRPGGGARFGFAIPLGADGAEVPHLLICAEAAPAVCALRRLAEAEGCSADRVATADDAHAAIRSGTYDAVLIDLDGADAVGPRFLTGLSDAAVDGRLPVPVIARAAGTLRIGTGTARAAWPVFDPAGGGLACQIRALRDGIGRARPLILHVDGNAALVEQTAAALRRRARLHCAPDLAGAFAMLARERPALLILDQDMPDGAATVLLDRLATATADGAATATILYSARPVAAELERRVDCVVMQSPRSAANLIAAVDRLLARMGGGPARDPGDDRDRAASWAGEAAA